MHEISCLKRRYGGIIIKKILPRMLVNIWQQTKLNLKLYTMVGNIFNYIIRSFILCSICQSQCFRGRLSYPASAKNSLCVLVGPGGGGTREFGICFVNFSQGVGHLISLICQIPTPTSPGGGGGGRFDLQ